MFNQMHLSLERDFEMAVIIFYFTASTKWYKETGEDDKTTITSPTIRLQLRLPIPTVLHTLAPYLAANAWCYGGDKQKQAFKNPQKSYVNQSVKCLKKLQSFL